MDNPFKNTPNPSHFIFKNFENFKNFKNKRTQTHNFKQKNMKLISMAMAVLAVSVCQLQTLAQTQQPKLTLEDDQLINKTCSSTPHNDLCKSLLQLSPKSSGADLYGLAQIMLDIAADQVSNIHDEITKIQNNTQIDSLMDECLTDCLENYQDAIDQIEDSITAIEFKAYHDIKTWVAAAMSDVVFCDMGFKEKPGYKSPIADKTAVFEQICSIILAMARLLTEGNNKAGATLFF